MSLMLKVFFDKLLFSYFTVVKFLFKDCTKMCSYFHFSYAAATFTRKYSLQVAPSVTSTSIAHWLTIEECTENYIFVQSFLIRHKSPSIQSSYTLFE